MQRDKKLLNFQNILNENSLILPQLQKWDIFCFNNKEYAHWRTWPISKERHLIRTFVK